MISHEDMIEELFDLGSLTKRENSFLTSLYDRLSRGSKLSEAQVEKLEQIYKERGR